MRVALFVTACAAWAACDAANIDALAGPGACAGLARGAGDPAMPADAVVESFGIRPTSGLAGDAVARERLSELGTRYVLLNYEVDRIATRATAQALGLRGLISIERIDVAADALSFFSGLATAITYRENAPVTPGWGDRVRAVQRQLWDLVKQNPATRAIDVVGPNAESSEQIAAVGDLAAWVDYGTCFPYRTDEINQPPGARAESDLARHASVYPGKPFVVPQVGYDTSADGVSEVVQAKYLARTLLEHARLGIRRTFLLELSDTENAGGFGLLRSDGSPKPSFAALRRLLDQLADPGPAFAPGRLAFALAGAPADVHHLLLEKRNGVFYLALWREIGSADADAEAPVTLQLAAPARSLKAYAPLGPVAPISVAAGRELALTISDAPLVVAIEPACE